MIRSARVRAVAAVAGVVWAGACGGERDGPPEPAASDSAEPAEARPDRPRNRPGPGSVPAPGRGSRPRGLRQPRDLALDDQGRLIVLDCRSRSPQIVTFEPSGSTRSASGSLMTAPTGSARRTSSR
jgi:hypothetical protein